MASSAEIESGPGCGLLSIKEIEEAAEGIKGRVHETPVLTCSALDDIASRSLVPPRSLALFFKCENFQKTGSFKARGALNAVRQLSESDKGKGVCTHSSGNHAQALAFAAKSFQLPCAVVMPCTASAVKRQAVAETYGGEVISCGPLPSDREEVCSRVMEERGCAFVHPANDLRVIAGQGTATLELFRQVSALSPPPASTSSPGKILDIVIVPVGGGGLASGTCVAAKSLDPSVLVIGAEPLGADDAKRSLAAGHIIPQTDPKTIADGLRTSIYSNTFKILKRNLERIITVTEEEIYRATRLLWERLKIIVEPSCAVTLAAVLSAEFSEVLSRLPHSSAPTVRIALILSGGNVDFSTFKFP